MSITHHSNSVHTKISLPSEEIVANKKKSILLTSEYKRGSSKATIQWEESVKEKYFDERFKIDKKNRLHALGLLVSRGSKWSYIQEVMTKLKAEEARMLGKTSEEFSFDQISVKRMNSLVRELFSGMIQKDITKGVELTLEQQTELVLLKHKIKCENDNYLKRHPELFVLLSLVYRKLLKTKPNDPKLFVAKYVHHLNIHRDELVLDEVDVPFDRPAEKEKDLIEFEVNERQEVEMFAKELVQKCADIASKRAAYVNVTNIIESILEKVSPSEEEVGSTRRRAEVAVSEILSSLLTSVALSRTKSSDIIVEQILDSVLENVCPSVSKDSEVFLEMKGSVENFVTSLLKTVVEKAAKGIRLRKRLSKYEKTISGDDSHEGSLQDLYSVTSKSILKKIDSYQSRVDTISRQISSEKAEAKMKVKFKSITTHSSSSKHETLP